MKLSEGSAIYRRIVAALIIIILTAGIEAGFNYPAIQNQYGSLDVSDWIEQVESGKNSAKYVITYESPDPEGIYVKQVRLRGLIYASKRYTIETTEINAFGKEEAHSYSDTASPWFTEFYTNINQTVTSITITLSKDEGEQLWSAELTNQVEVNKYRVAFFLIVFVLIYCALFEKMLKEKVEWFFLIFALSFGILLIQCAQPIGNSWDEEIHFGRVYMLANGKNIEWSTAALKILNSERITCNTKIEYAMLRNLMDEWGMEVAGIETRESMDFSYKDIAYVPAVIGLKAGMLLHLPFSKLFAAGKMAGLLFYAFIMFWAIRLAKRRKLFLLFLAVMPTVMFLACSYTYDSIVFSFITLGGVLWGNEMFSRKEDHHVFPLLLTLFLFVVGSLSKAVYIPVVLLLLLLPQIQKQSRKKKLIFGIVVIVLFMVVMLTFVAPVFSGFMAKDYSLVGDDRGGDTNIVGQLISMSEHIWASITLTMKEIIRLDNFSIYNSKSSTNHIVGNVMLLNYYRWGIMSEKWGLLLIPVITLMLLYRDDSEKDLKQLRIGQSIWAVLVLMFMVLLIWLSMYLSFTPVGDTEIVGVQTRYYLPLLYPAVLLIQNKKVFLNISYAGITRVCMISAIVLGAVSMYDLVLKTRLF